MSKKDSEVPIDEEARLQTAVGRVEEEVALFKKWQANNSSRSQRTTRTDGGALAVSAGQNPSRTKVVAPATDGRSNLLLQRIVSQLKWGGIVGIIAVIIAALGVVINSSRNTQIVVQQIQLNNLEITEPPNGASVGLGQIVRGNTPYSGLNHYLLVTLVRTGSVNLQPAHVNPDGTFTGEVRFTDNASNAAAGEDDEFTVRVMATKEQLSSGYQSSFPADAKISRQIIVRRSKPTEQFAITLPTSGATVGLDDRVSGSTPFAGLNHYIIVIPLRVGTAYVQDQPATVSNGRFDGRARFGGVSVGIGEQFAVQILATKSTLPAGPLLKQPEDAVLSNSITVTRKQ
jgi:hypothetical protein